MRPEDIRRHIDNNTFLTALMRQTVVKPHESENGKLMLEMVFPDWYFEYISEESQAQIEAFLRSNLQTRYRQRAECDRTDQPIEFEIPNDESTR